MGAALRVSSPHRLPLEIDKLIGGMPSQMVNFFGKPVGTVAAHDLEVRPDVRPHDRPLVEVLGLSATLAGEQLRRRTWTSSRSRRSASGNQALEKLAAHVTMLGLALAFMAVLIVRCPTPSATRPSAINYSPLCARVRAVGWGPSPCSSAAWRSRSRPSLAEPERGVAGIALALAWTVNGLNSIPWTCKPFPLDLQPHHGAYWAGVALVRVDQRPCCSRYEHHAVRAHRYSVTAGVGLPQLPASVLGVRGPTAAFGR